MRLQLVVLVLATVAGAAGAGPVSASAAGSGLRVTGDGRSYAVIQIPAGVRLKHDDWALTGTGRYRVALLDRIIANRQDAGFNVLLAQSPMLGNGRVALGPVDDVAVPPGRYRLFLISDRPAALRLALPGMPVRSITTEHRSSGTAAVDRAPPATGLPQSVSSVRRDLLARGMVVFQASRWDAPSGGARVYSNVVNTCLAPAGGDCPDDLTDTGMTGVTRSSGPSHVEYAGYADTFDVPERASAITSWRGTDRPSAGKQLVVTFPVV